MSSIDEGERLRLYTWLSIWLHLLICQCYITAQTASNTHTLDLPDTDTVASPYTVTRTDEHRRVRREIPSHMFKPIRINPQFLNIGRQLPNASSEALFVELVTQARLYISGFLSVIPVNGSILLERNFSSYCFDPVSLGSQKCRVLQPSLGPENCGIDGFEIPGTHLAELRKWSDEANYEVVQPAGRGVNNTDLILYVTVQTISFCATKNPVLAFASICRRDQNGRPLASMLNLCATEFSSSSRSMLLKTLTHEMLHAVGFTGESIGEFRQCSLEAGEVVCQKPYALTGGFPSGALQENYDIFWLLTPNVMAAAARHFNCSQSFYGPGWSVFSTTKRYLAGSHWNFTYMAGSIMAPVFSEDKLEALDPMTVAFFKDTGWYYVNESYVESFVWGKGQGCAFASREFCAPITQGLVNNPFFCSNRSRSGCHYLHLHKGTCVPTEPNNLCYYYKPDADGQCFVERPSRNGSDAFCKDCRCFVSNISTTEPGEPRGVCYQRRCTQQGEIEVLLMGSWQLCPPGRTIQVTGYQGSVHCPAVGVLCTERDMSFTSTTKAGTVIPLQPLITSTRPTFTTAPLISSTSHPAATVLLAFHADYTWLEAAGVLEEFSSLATQQVCTVAKISISRVIDQQLRPGSVIYTATILAAPPGSKELSPQEVVQVVEAELPNLSIVLSDGAVYTPVRNEETTTQSIHVLITIAYSKGIGLPAEVAIGVVIPCAVIAMSAVVFLYLKKFRKSVGSNQLAVKCVFKPKDDEPAQPATSDINGSAMELDA